MAEKIHDADMLEALYSTALGGRVDGEGVREKVRPMMETNLKRLERTTRRTPVEPAHERFKRNMLETTKDRQIISSALLRPCVPVHEACSFGENVKFLHAEQSLVGSDIELWFLDDIESPPQTSYIRSFYEGDVVPEGHEHITSVRLRTGDTWHIFRTMENPSKETE